MTDLKEKLRTTNLLSQRNQRALQNEAADRIEKLEAALREIAAEAYVSDDYLQPHNYPNGWRKVAVDRIDIARAALKEMA